MNDAPVKLTCKEFAILDLLMSRKGAVLTKEAFIGKKLDQFGAGGLISTVWGRGYAINPAGRSFEFVANVIRFPAIETG